MDCLYRSNNLLVRAVPADDRRIWLVTFGNHESAVGVDRPGFGETFLAHENCSAIHVIGRSNDWYQYADTPQALGAIRAYLAAQGADRVVTYGSSMGGYAAIHFAAAIGAQAVLALSPQFSNNPRITPWEVRWLDDAHRIKWLAQLEGIAEIVPRTIVLYDPTSPDGRHAALIGKHFGAELLPLRYTGHPVATFLSEIGLLRSLVSGVRFDKFDAASFLREAISRRRASSVYLTHLSLAQPGHRTQLAVAVAERAVATNSANTEAVQCLGMALSRAGRHEEAIAGLEDVVQRTENKNLHHLYWLAEAYSAAGHHDKALQPMARAVALAPDQAHLWAWYALCLARVGDFREAARKQNLAVQLSPSRRRYRKQYWKYRLRSLLAILRRSHRHQAVWPAGTILGK